MTNVLLCSWERAGGSKGESASCSAASPAREELAGGTGQGCSWDCSVGLQLFVATSTSEMFSKKAAELL